MKNKFFFLLFGFLFAAILSATPAENAAMDWSHHKYGLFIHFGMDTFRKAGERGELPAGRFAPASLDVASWVRAAKQSGMTFAVVSAKHESGFCLWPSKDYGYDVSQSPVKKDILREFVTACQTEGIEPGVCYSIPDGHNEGTVNFKKPVLPPYFEIVKKHITELCVSYPEFRFVFLDGIGKLSPTQMDELQKIIHHQKPNCYIGDANGGPHYADATIIKSWMWHPNSPLNPAEQLFAKYQSAVAAHKALVLNVGPAPSGKIPDDQIAVLLQLNKLIANAPALAPAATAPDAKPDTAERLKKVKTLFDQGLINKDDYDKKVKEIMDAL